MSDFVKNVTEFEFVNLLKTESKPILVDFWARWCSPCRMQAPILDELAQDLQDKVVIVKVDVDECESLAIKYGVNAIPCLMVFKNGELAQRHEGLSGKSDLAAMLIRHV